VTAGASGKGNGSVSLHVAANAGTASRTGTVTIAGHVFTVTEAATATTTTAATASSEGCTYLLGRTSSTSTAAGGADSGKMTAPSGCTWHATSDSSWLAILAGSGNGSGWVTYSVAKNTGATRTGRITVAGIIFTVTQP